jgi:feruloyl-CoA synthase
MMLVDGPDAAAGELTDKGTINQRVFLANRPQLLARLYGEPVDPQVFVPSVRRRP